MKKAFIVPFLIIFTMNFTNVLIAQEEDRQTGNFLYRILMDDKHPGSLYNMGIVDGRISGIWGAYDGLLWDIPIGMTLGQAVDIVKNYLEAYPETRHLNWKQLTVAALAEKLPKAKNPKEELDRLLFIWY